MEIKELVEESKKVKRGNNKKGHITFTKDVIRKIYKVVSKEEFLKLDRGRVEYVVLKKMKEENPILYKWVKENRGKKFVDQVGSCLSEIKKEVKESK